MTSALWAQAVWAWLFLSLGWSLRGQFGHLRGALIPGALAAAAIALGRRSEPWRRAFGWAVVLGAAGFSVGGYFGYGLTIERIVHAPRVLAAFPDLARIFWTGAVWGGFGATALGFGFSEQPWRFRDGVVYGLLGAVGLLILGVLKAEAYDLWVVGAALVALQVYNARCKRSRIISLFGAAGVAGFGGGFLLAALLLHAGHRQWFGTGWPWWHLRDQILGGCGGIALAWASHTAARLGLAPAPRPAGGWGWRIGLAWYLAGIPLMNALGVVDSWIEERPIASLDTLRILRTGLVWGFVVLAIGLVRRFASSRHPAPPRALRDATIAVIWFLSAAAIAKEMVPLGWARWEPAFTLFLIYSAMLTILLVRYPLEEQP